MVWYEGGGTGDRRYLHTDERGSVIAVTDNGGAAIAINAYDEYGIPQSTNQGLFQYTGQAWLASIGLYYYKARMYAPTLGRFMQTDPIGYGDGMNWYNYTHSDPANGIDPFGLTAYFCTADGSCRDGGGNKVDPRKKLEPGDTVNVGNKTWNSDGVGGGYISTRDWSPASSGSMASGVDEPQKATDGDIIVTAQLAPAITRAMGRFSGIPMSVPDVIIQNIVGFPTAANDIPQYVLQSPADKTRKSAPTNAPRGTRPINAAGIGRGELHGIKDQIAAAPDDWVGVTPDGRIITTGPDGRAVDHGHRGDF